MAITGNKKEASASSSYSKSYGISGYDILGVNMSNKDLKALGFYVKEEDEDKAREFVSERDGVAVVQLEFACQSKGPDKKLRKFSFWLENKNSRNSEEKERALFKFINDQGRTAWSLKPNEFVGLSEAYSVYFTGQDDAYNPRPAKRGEEEFMLFMRACMAIDFKNGGTIKYNLKKLFNGNFKEIQDDLKSDFLTPVIVATTIKVKQTDEGMKEYESFYPYAFAPGSNFKFLMNKKDYTDEDVAQIHAKISGNKTKKGKERTYVTPLEELIAKMTDKEYPCKDVFHLGLVKDYVSDGHVESAGSAIISEDDLPVYEDDDDTSKY